MFTKKVSHEKVEICFISLKTYAEEQFVLPQEKQQEKQDQEDASQAVFSLFGSSSVCVSSSSAS